MDPRNRKVSGLLLICILIQTQTYGGSFAPFNNCVVLGLSILISLDMGEMPAPEIYSEHLTYLQDFVQRLQSDLDDGRDGTTAQKERTIMDSILARLDALINNDEGPVRSGRGPNSASGHGHPGMFSAEDEIGPLMSLCLASAQHHPHAANPRPVVMPSPGTSGQSTPYDANHANAQMALIDFDPTALGFDPNTILDSQAPFDWEVYLSEMYNEGNLFMN